MTSTASPPQPISYMWTNARLLVVETAIDPATAQAMLPDALKLTDPPTATLFVADYPETQFGSVYREAAVILHAADSEGEALHCPWMVVDDDTALIFGREILGFPKKMAEIKLEERGKSVVGTVVRKGVEIMRIEAEVGAAEEKPEPLFGRRMVNAIGTLPGGMKLIELPAGQAKTHSYRPVEAKVTLTSSERDMLGELKTPPSTKGRYVRVDFGGSDLQAGLRILGDADESFLWRRFFPRAL